MDIVEKHSGDIFYYELERFKKTGIVNHLFSSRIGWTTENTVENISKIFNIPKKNILYLKQIHGNHIEIISKNTFKDNKIVGKEGDGLITNLPNISLMTYHADCVPIYFVDTEKKIIGLAHGGWKGSFENISGKMVDSFIKVFDSNTRDILTAIGPSIGPCCYEISEDLGNKFMERYMVFSDILMKKGSKVYLDLWKLNYYQLKKAGILEENIVLSNACTSCNIDRFYSYRKEATSNRMVAAMALF